MKKLLIFALIATLMQLMLIAPKMVRADGRLHLEISALQTGTAASASNEYIKVYNPNPDAVDITGWKLQYRSASSTGSVSWTTKLTFSCQPKPGESSCQTLVAPNDEAIAASYDVPGKTFTLSSGMAGAGGQIQLVSPNGKDWTVEDMVGYGTAAVAEGNH